MEEPSWVNARTKYCLRCRVEYPLREEKCPRCNGVLMDKVRREPAEED